VHRSPHAASIDRARQYVIEGRFDEAVAVLTRVYENQKADAKYRAQALFELGQTHSHLLNPRRDEDKALLYFEKLVEEYPESELRTEAEKKIERMRPS
jgi:tetratricopeptide (TPR) repeat protein